MGLSVKSITWEKDGQEFYKYDPDASPYAILSNTIGVQLKVILIQTMLHDELISFLTFRRMHFSMVHGSQLVQQQKKLLGFIHALQNFVILSFLV